jgi:hypothetical protein
LNQKALSHFFIDETEMKSIEKQLESITTLLRAETTVSLATTGDDGEPCVAPLFYIVDEELSLYWLSAESSRHGLNVKKSPRAAATVYAEAAGWKQIRGVQMRGSVSLVADPARLGALVKAYCERFELGAIFRVAIRRSTLYALRPEYFRYIDNTKRFGYNFELTRGDEGWSCTRPAR